MKKNTAKKMLSFVLCVLMVCSVLLTSCKDDEESEPTTIRVAKSVVMAVVCEKEVDSETESAIEDAFNAITKAQYKTQVDLRFYTEDEYYTEIVALIKRIYEDNVSAENDKNNNKNDETTAETEEETVKNEEYGYAETVYPVILENQLDILYIGGYDMFKAFYDGDSNEEVSNIGTYLARLDEDLSTNSKLITDYIFPEYMEACKYMGSTYAIPNNAVATGFTYLLVNKELANKYQYAENMKSWTNILDASAFITDIAKFETGVLPVFGNPEPTNVHFWNYKQGVLGENPTYSINPYEFSIFGSSMSDDSEYGSNLGCAKTLTSTHTYAKQLLEIQRLKDSNYVSDTLGEDQKFAVGFFKGNEYDIKAYTDEYEVIVCETPRFTDSGIFDSMFGVCSLSKVNVDRNMEIITAINTNEELRNILQYGIEGVHYEIDAKTGILSRLNDKYMMDVNKTGNVFLAHAEEGIDPSYMEDAKKQNIAALLYPSAGFNPSVLDSMDKLNGELVEKTNALTAKYKEKLDACNSVADLEAVFEEYAADREVSSLHSSWNDLEPSEEIYSPYALYYKWLESNGFLEGEDG